MAAVFRSFNHQSSLPTMTNRRKAELSTAQAEVPSPASASSRSETSINSKPSSSTEPPKAQIDFQFLNFSHPSDAKKSKTRRAVRSHVTRHQHQREQAAVLARRARSTQSPTDTTQPPSQLPTGEPALKIDIPTASGSAPSTLVSETSSPSPSPAVSPTRERRIDPAEVYPDAWHAHIPRIMDHYMSNMAIEIPEHDDAEIKQILRTRFFPFVLTDPALLHAVMLMAAAYYQSVYGPRSHEIDLFHLRGMAIREINRALEDPIRATSDQVVVAVAKMGSYEALYGDRASFNTHMTGLLRMVSLRGGLPALGLDGLIVRMLLWIDANTANMAGVSVYFDPEAFTSPYSHPEPDPRRFPGPLPSSPIS